MQDALQAQIVIRKMSELSESPEQTDRRRPAMDDDNNPLVTSAGPQVRPEPQCYNYNHRSETLKLRL